MNYTVIIPVCNAAQYLEKAVNSALQFELVKEVILVEDGSKDNSLEICQKLQNQFSKVKLYTHPNNENRGAGASRNLAISKVNTPFFSFLDADDFFLPNRFTKELEVLATNPNAEVVYNALGSHYYREKSTNDNFNTLTTVKKQCTPQDFLKAFLGLKYKDFGSLSLVAMTFKTEAVRKHNLQFNEGLRLHQDTDFIIKAAHYLKFYPGEIIMPVALRGVHEHNRINANKVHSPQYLQNKILFTKELLKWMQKEQLNWLLQLPLKLEKHYYTALKNKQLILAKNIIRLRYRLYLLNKFMP